MKGPPPAPDQIEISVFGPGFGESIVAHCGCGDWIIVDSCRNPDSSAPVALEYLEQLGVDPAKAVKFVVATHWDADHIKGLSAVFQACKSAEFVLSSALKSEHFVALVYGTAEDFVSARSTAADEIVEIIDELKTRRPKRRKIRPPVFASADQRLVGDSCKLAGVQVPREIWTLSPSAYARARSLAEIGRISLSDNDPILQLSALENNHTSVVVWIRVGNRVALLGADLEEHDNPVDGWSAILASQGKPTGKATIFKIPHHGSSNGHHADVWNNMIVAPGVAAITPWINADGRLPTPADVTRICGYTRYTFLTGDAAYGRPKREDAFVEKLLRDFDKEITELRRTLGHVRFRSPVNAVEDIWSVECLGAARCLSS